MKTILSALLLASLAVSVADAATFSGTVTNDAPLANMTVVAYNGAGAVQASATTGAAGAYSLTVPAGTYRLLAYDPAGVYATSFYADAESFETSTTLTVTATQAMTNLNFRLVHAGRVTGQTNGNVTVAAYNPDGTRRGFTTSSASGAYALTLPPGVYRIAAYDDTLTFATMFFANATSFAAASPVTVSAAETTAGIDVPLPLAAKVTGSVTDRTTLQPLAGMRVTVYGADGNVSGIAVTGVDGKFALAAIAGALRIVIDDPSGNYATTFYPDAEAFSVEAPIAVAPGSSVAIAATLVRAGRIAGRATDRATGVPLANIAVAAYNADGTLRSRASTNASGDYTLVTPPGDFVVGAFDDALAYLPQFYPAASFVDATRVHVTAQQTVGGIDFALFLAGRISGNVVDATTDVPLGGLRVIAYDANGNAAGEVTVNAAGAFRIALTPGSYRLAAVDDQHHYATQFYAGVTTFEAATSVTIAGGQEYGGVGFRLSAAITVTRRRVASR